MWPPVCEYINLEKALSNFLNSGLTAHRKGRLEEAARAYLQVLREAPGNYDALQLLGMLRHQQGRMPEAAELLEKALAVRPGHAGTLNALAAVLLAGGNAGGAAEKARAALAKNPQDPQALYTLGGAQRMLGRLEEAGAALEKSLGIRPDAPDAQNALGIVRHEQARYAQAAAHFKTALQLRPGHPDYLNNLGFALLEGGDPHAARPVLEQAVATRPAFGEALVNLGRALHELGLDEQALEVLNAAREVDPSVAAVPVNLGISLQSLDRPREAEQAFLAALDLHPENVAGLAQLAALYESSNRLELANETVRRGLALTPGDPFLNLVAAKCERRAGEFAKAGARLEAALSSHPGERWSQALLYEQARNLDRAGSFAAAMDAATRANQLAQSHWRHLTSGENRYNAMLDELTQATRGGWIEKWRPLAEEVPGPTPVFLVGFPRSGTTLLDTLIGGHPDFVVLEEKPALEAIRKSLDARPGGFIEALTELDEAGRSALLKIYLDDVEKILGEPVGHRRLLDKLPLNILMLPVIRRIFPMAKVIMALRHPADVCLSCFFQEFDYRQSPAMANFLSMQDTVDFYGKVMALWQLYQKALPLEMHTIRYEDLVTDTEGRMRALFEFLQCPWDARILEHHREVRRRGTIDTPSYHQVSQPIYTQARFRWRNYAAELAPWLDTLHAWADRLGYPPPAAPGNDSDNA